MLAAFRDRLAGRLADLSIVKSFDRSGFERHARNFPAEQQQDLRGQVCLVTGANSGLGLATARELARRGARLYLLCRDEARGRSARDMLRTETGGEVELALVDLSLPSSIDDFVSQLDESTAVDVLIHNAGVLPEHRVETIDGFELTWATHVVGPQRLTWRLLPRLRASAQARVIFVSSGGMYTRRLNLDDVNWKRRRSYDGVVAYAETKRAQVVLAELWAERLAETQVTVNSMHPGWADTPAVRKSLPRFYERMSRRLRTPEQGADTIVWLATSEHPAHERGGFWFDRRRRPTHFLPWTRERAADRRELWRLCCADAGVPEDPLG